MLPVSVVIPCYKCKETISRAVASVEAQMGAPVEVIIVDDASDDGTLSFLEKLRASYAPGWIRIVKLGQNEGPGGARNAGWREATQPYIAFLDADDSWHPLKLHHQIAWMEQNPDVVLTGHPCPLFEKYAVEMAIPKNITAWQVRREDILRSNVFPTRSVVLRRDIPFRFNPEKRFCEDYLLWMQIVLSGLPAWRMDAPLGFVHKHIFAESGLSRNLWKMEKGELDAYRCIWVSGLIELPHFVMVCAVSLVKYVRRLFIVYFDIKRHSS